MDDLATIGLLVVFFAALVWQVATGSTYSINERPSYLRHRQPGPYWRSVIGQALIFTTVAVGFVATRQMEDFDDWWDDFGRKLVQAPQARPDGEIAASKVPIDSLQDLRQAVERSPSDFEAHRQLDYALARQGRWDEILAMWDRYLAQHPNDAEAWFERGGTNYHRGDAEAARADAARACELGKREACERLKRLEAGS